MGPGAVSGSDRGAPEGFLLVIALLMIGFLIYGNLRYEGVPDAAGRTFDHCALEVAGFAWFCA